MYWPRSSCDWLPVAAPALVAPDFDWAARGNAANPNVTRENKESRVSLFISLSVINMHDRILRSLLVDRATMTNPARYDADGMLDGIAAFIARHHMLTPGQRVGVAVSGGADSVFLLHAMQELAPRWDLQLSVVHIEHGIRGPESVADAEFVRDLAASLGLPFHLHQADVPAIQGNLEQAARNVRQSFYAELIASGAVDRVATGHTRSDQAETVLYRILRGSGLTGLSGILPATSEGLIRPLLEIDRCEIEGWLKAHRIPWREDATNADPSYARNRIRHEILPLLRGGFNPQLDEALAHLAALARDEEEYWETEIARHLPQSALHQPLVLPVSQFADVPTALARRLVRRAMQNVKGDLNAIEFEHVERVLEMARAREGHDRAQAPGLEIFRSFDWIRICPASSAPRPDFAIPLPIPGSVELPASAIRITLQVLDKQEAIHPCGTVVNELDWLRLRKDDGAPNLELRNWRPGDQYRRVGRIKSEKIKFFFQQDRVPLWERTQLADYHLSWTNRLGQAVRASCRIRRRPPIPVWSSGWTKRQHNFRIDSR